MYIILVVQSYIYDENRTEFSNLVKKDQTARKFTSVKLDDFDEPVDAVYTWVNGSDIEFINSLQSETKAADPGGRRFTGNYFSLGSFYCQLGTVPSITRGFFFDPVS